MHHQRPHPPEGRPSISWTILTKMTMTTTMMTSLPRSLLPNRLDPQPRQHPRISQPLSLQEHRQEHQPQVRTSGRLCLTPEILRSTSHLILTTHHPKSRRNPSLSLPSLSTQQPWEEVQLAPLPTHWSEREKKRRRDRRWPSRTLPLAVSLKATSIMVTSQRNPRAQAPSE